MEYTTNLNLKKPAYSDPADIADINGNMDVIDESITEILVEDKSVNLYDNSTFVENKWIMFNGVETDGVGYAHSNGITLNAGTYLVSALKGSFGASANYIHLYDDSDVWTGKIIADYVIDNGNDSVVKFSLNQKSVIKINFTTTIKNVMVVKGETAQDFPTEYVPYKNGKKFGEGIHISETLEQDVLVVSEKNPLKGKKISLNGDSICYGVGYIGGYGKIIADRNDMRYQNIAFGGGTIATGTTAGSENRHWISTTVENLDDDADYIILEGGVNDSSLSVPLGTFVVGFDSAFDTSTFYGALDYMFKKLIIKFKGKKYGFIIPHQMSGGMMPNADYYNAIMKSASKWGVPILDLSTQIPPLGRIVTSSEMYVLTQTYTNNSDGWHPNEEGYKKYYCDKIEAWMKTL